MIMLKLSRFRLPARTEKAKGNKANVAMSLKALRKNVVCILYWITLKYFDKDFY